MSEGPPNQRVLFAKQLSSIFVPFRKAGDVGPLKWTNTGGPGRGLINVGNTCFLNAILQAFAHCPPIAQYMKQKRHSRRCTYYASRLMCGMCDLEAHINAVFDNKSGAIVPVFVKRLEKHIWKRSRVLGCQQCAHEGLKKFLEWLRQFDVPEDLKAAYVSNKIGAAELSTSYINQLFVGSWISTKVCNDCRHASVRSDPFDEIEVSLTGQIASKVH